MTKKLRPRKRGTASVPCPKTGCGRPTRVLRTTRTGGTVTRERVCTRNHKFGTMEATCDSNT